MAEKVQTQKQQQKQEQQTHPLNETEQQYINSMTQQQRELHELATKMLGSSYFVGKTHGFTAWLKQQK